jgi:hypothetical protein
MGCCQKKKESSKGQEEPPTIKASINNSDKGEGERKKFKIQKLA